MTLMIPGPNNLITDVIGINVGNAEDMDCITGVTAIIPDAPVVAAADVRGGAPGTRDISLFDPASLVERIHGIVLSGGSVFGLDAAGGVISALAARGIGFTFGEQPLPCPVVPSAILFDLMNGGDKDWGNNPPYWALGQAACAAAGQTFSLGNSGAGLGATAGSLKGGLGSTSAIINGITVGALVAVNSFGSAVDPRTDDLWAAPYELDDEFGGRRSQQTGAPVSTSTGTKIAGANLGGNTTIAVVATDAALTKGDARRLAIMAADGMARALRPVHAPFDGDTVFAISTGQPDQPTLSPTALTHLGTAAADTLARAIGRAVYEATPIPGYQSWRDTL